MQQHPAPEVQAARSRRALCVIPSVWRSRRSSVPSGRITSVRVTVGTVWNWTPTPPPCSCLMPREMIRPRNTLCSAHRRAHLARQTPRHRPGTGRDALQAAGEEQGRIGLSPPRGGTSASGAYLVDGQQQGTLDTLHDPAVAHLHIDIAHRPEGDRTGRPCPATISARPMDPNPICRVVRPTSSASPSTASSASCTFGCSASGNSAPVVGKPLGSVPRCSRSRTATWSFTRSSATSDITRMNSTNTTQTTQDQEARS